MSGNDLMVRTDSAMIEKVVVGGDLSPLTPTERLSYYYAVCESIGLNPLTKPFDYIRLNNKLVLYAKRDATDQLRDKRKVSVVIASREKIEDVYVVTAKATMPDGRTDESIGAVSVAGLKGDALANAFMKAETKAKRRVTLSIVGLGWLDETEVETIPGVRVDVVNIETGEVARPTDQPAEEGPTFASLDELLYRLYQEFQLTEAEAKTKLKELGYTGWPKNGGAKKKSTEMYLAVKKAVQAPVDELGFMEGEPVEA